MGVRREDSELPVALKAADWREGAARRHDQLGWDTLLGRAHCGNDRVDLHLRRGRTLEEDAVQRAHRLRRRRGLARAVTCAASGVAQLGPRTPRPRGPRAESALRGG